MEGEDQGVFRAQVGLVAFSRVLKEADIKTRIRVDIRAKVQGGTNNSSREDMVDRHRVKVGVIWVVWEVEEILVGEVWVEEVIWEVEGDISRVPHRTIRVDFSLHKGVRDKGRGVLLMEMATVTTDRISLSIISNSKTFFSE